MIHTINSGVITMNMNEYQQLALRTTRGHDEKNELFHLLLGLVGETGEVAEKIKKVVRDYDTDLSKLDRGAITKELGDTLWYIAVLADYLGIPLEDVASQNIDKLASRQSRNKLRGSGDNR